MKELGHHRASQAETRLKMAGEYQALDLVFATGLYTLRI